MHFKLFIVYLIKIIAFERKKIHALRVVDDIICYIGN